MQGKSSKKNEMKTPSETHDGRDPQSPKPHDTISDSGKEKTLSDANDATKIEWASIMRFIHFCATNVCHDGNSYWDIIPDIFKGEILTILHQIEINATSITPSDEAFAKYRSLMSAISGIKIDKVERKQIKGILNVIEMASKAIQTPLSNLVKLRKHAKEIVERSVKRAVPSDKRLHFLGGILHQCTELPQRLQEIIKICIIVYIIDSDSSSKWPSSHEDRQDRLETCLHLLQQCSEIIQWFDIVNASTPLPSKQEETIQAIKSQTAAIREKIEQWFRHKAHVEPIATETQHDVCGESIASDMISGEQLLEEVNQLDTAMEQAKIPALNLFQEYVDRFEGQRFNEELRGLVVDSISELAVKHRIRLIYSGSAVNIRLKPNNRKFQLREVGGARKPRYERWEFPQLRVEFIERKSQKN